ncbi:MAG TPA: DUF3566 domain-containing protein [Acidimicrobiales bacterium]|nr:DUF3566 domain-containing protein [Acidimicrobiales bacterium]
MSADQPGVTAAPGTVGDTDNGLVVPKRRHRFAPGDPALAPVEPEAPEVAHAAPHKLSRRERKKLGRLRARKVHRVVRHIDPWSVLRLSLLFYFCLFVVVMVAGTLLYNVAGAAGTIGSIESFIKDIGAFKTFSFKGGTIFRASLLAGLILVIAGSAFNVLLTVLFNLISDLVGGVRVTVIEEETARPIPSSADVNKR